MNKNAKIYQTLRKEKFGFDVDALPAYTNEESGEFIQDLIGSSTWLSNLTVLEGVKGKETIKLLEADIAINAFEGCTVTSEGEVVFDGRDIETKRLQSSIEFCNDDLNGKYTQILNAIGANRQDLEMPLEEVLKAYLAKRLMQKIQRLILLGDTTSLNTDLAHFDGAIKLIENDADVVTVPVEATLFETAQGVIAGIDEDVFDNEVAHEVIVSRTTAQGILNEIYADKDYNALTIDVDRANGQLSFILPTTNTRIRSINTLKGNNNMYAVCYPYMFIGTDLESDWQALELKIDDYNNKIKMEVFYRLGFQFVLPQYFVRTDSTIS